MIDVSPPRSPDRDWMRALDCQQALAPGFNQLAMSGLRRHSAAKELLRLAVTLYRGETIRASTDRGTGFLRLVDDACKAGWLLEEVASALVALGYQHNNEFTMIWPRTAGSKPAREH